MARLRIRHWLPSTSDEEKVRPNVGVTDEEIEESRRQMEGHMRLVVAEHYRKQQAELRERAVPTSDTPPLTELPGQGRCVGYVIAKRAWQLDLVEGLLTSQHDTTWHVGSPVRADDPPIPTMAGYGAGIYGMKLDQPAQELEPFTGRGDMTAYGLVALWGRIKEHAKGYRAEWAYPLEIKRLNFDGPFHDVLLDALNERYGCRPHKEEAPCVLTDPRDRMRAFQQAAMSALQAQAHQQALLQQIQQPGPIMGPKDPFNIGGP